MTQTRRNLVLAFLLSIFPGGGQLYYGNVIRGILYALGVLFCLMVTFSLLYSYSDLYVLSGTGGLLLYFSSFLDTIVVGARRLQRTSDNPALNSDQSNEATTGAEHERFYTILLAFVPGVGHFQLGLMNRGLAFLSVFFGALIMIFFTAFLLNQMAILFFLFFLPVLWVYGFFDAIQLLNKKQRGETLTDRSFLEDLEKHSEGGRKSKSVATLLSIFPGAGHLYLGYQRRGVQLMAFFLFSLYILDALRLGIFLFLIPIIWFYSFFDGMQKANQHSGNEVDDKPLVGMLMHQHRWIGIGLVCLGLFFFMDRVLVPSLNFSLLDQLRIDLYGWYDEYFQVTVVSLLLIGGGIKLLLGFKSARDKADEKGKST